MREYLTGVKGPRCECANRSLQEDQDSFALTQISVEKRCESVSSPKSSEDKADSPLIPTTVCYYGTRTVVNTAYLGSVQ